MVTVFRKPPLRTVFCMVLLALVAGGCSSFYKQDEDITLNLLTFSAEMQPQLVKQTVTIQKDSVKLTYLSISRITAKELKTVALLPSGQQLYVLEYDGNQLRTTVSDLMKIQGDEIVAIQQFVLWPVESIREGYKKAGWGVVVSPDSRMLFYGGMPVLSVMYQSGEIVIHHHLDEYSMFIKSLEKNLE